MFVVRVPDLRCFPSTVMNLNSTGAISSRRGYYYIQNQGRNHLGEAKPMVGHIPSLFAIRFKYLKI